MRRIVLLRAVAATGKGSIQIKRQGEIRHHDKRNSSCVCAARRGANTCLVFTLGCRGLSHVAGVA
jgi:hypothetical protein